MRELVVLMHPVVHMSCKAASSASRMKKDVALTAFDSFCRGVAADRCAQPDG